MLSVTPSLRVKTLPSPLSAPDPPAALSAPSGPPSSPPPSSSFGLGFKPLACLHTHEMGGRGVRVQAAGLPGRGVRVQAAGLPGRGVRVQAAGLPALTKWGEGPEGG